MNEKTLRWQGRIGSMKSLGVLIVIVAGLVLITVGSEFVRAVQSPTAPVALSIPDLVADPSHASPYVSVTGDAYYDVGYQETENDRVVTTYFFLMDDHTGQTIVVRASSPEVEGGQRGKVTITGMIHAMPSGLQDAVRADVSRFSQQGITLNSAFYLAQDEQPPSVSTTFLETAVAGGLVLLGLVPLFFPSPVFAPGPVDSLTAIPAAGSRESGVRASGRFRQLRRLPPQVEVGSRQMKFNHAVANLVSLPDGRLMIYIHHVQRTTLYGVVTVSKRESDWAIMVSKNEPWQIDPGRLCAWKVRPAVRFVHYDSTRKAEAVYLSFDQVGAQVEFIQQMRSRGFPVGTGY